MKIFSIRNTKEYKKIYLFDNIVYYKKKQPSLDTGLVASGVDLTSSLRERERERAQI